VSRVTAIEGTLYAHAGRGFVVFDVYGGGARNQGTLLVHVVETAEGEEPVLTMSVELARETDASGRGSQVDPP
jgi:hypothetical protein